MRKEDALKDRISTPVHSETVSAPIISFKCTQDDIGTRLLPVSREQGLPEAPSFAPHRTADSSPAGSSEPINVHEMTSPRFMLQSNNRVALLTAGDRYRSLFVSVSWPLSPSAPQCPRSFIEFVHGMRIGWCAH